MTADRIIGVDPGASGALALLNAGGGVESVIDMPAHDGTVSGALIADWLATFLGNRAIPVGTQPVEAWVELVTPMGKQGLGSTFKFGRAYGTVLGALEALRIPVHHITPAKWKRAAGIPVGADKSVSRRLAIELWPTHSQTFARVKDDGRAEACLIARHGLITSNHQGEQATP